MANIINQANAGKERALSQRPMTVGQAAKFLNVSVSHIYKLTHRKEIPFFKCGKRNYFKMDELSNWAFRNRIMTKDEIESQAISYMLKGRRYS